MFQYSTHAFGVAEAIGMSKALGLLPRWFVLFGIEAHNFTLGTALSIKVATSLEEVVQLVQQEVGS